MSTDKFAKRAHELIDLIASQVKDSDTAASTWIAQGRKIAETFLSDGQEKAQKLYDGSRDYLKNSDQVKAVKSAAVKAGTKAKDNPLMTAAAIAAVAGTAYAINKRVKAKPADDSQDVL